MNVILPSLPLKHGPVTWRLSDLSGLQHRFQPQNPLSAAQPFSPRDVGSEEEELRLSAHTLLLPTRGQLEARMMVTAFEVGLDNVTDDAVSSMVHAVEVCTALVRTIWSVLGWA